jgi:bifunctional DNA-binding transcriptional regulator/antitoxin component of YhaV-PrlF toxin-antitoxin module
VRVDTRASDGDAGVRLVSRVEWGRKIRNTMSALRSTRNTVALARGGAIQLPTTLPSRTPNGTNRTPQGNRPPLHRTSPDRTGTAGSVAAWHRFDSTYVQARVAARRLACQGVGIHTFGMRYALGTSVGERGQITIEREIRAQLGIKPKDIAVQHVQDGKLVVEFVRPHEPHMRSIAGILGPSPRKPHEPLDVDDAVGRGLAEEWGHSVADETAANGVASTRRRRRRTS